jgi:hypothetical protein
LVNLRRIGNPALADPDGDSRWLMIALLFNGPFPIVGISQGQAAAVSAGPDGAAQIALANGLLNTALTV